MATARECIEKIICENIKGRKLVSIERFVALEDYLIEQGLKIDFYVSNDSRKVDNKNFYDISSIANKNNEFYVLIPYEPDENLKTCMQLCGYSLIEDYCYLQVMHKKVTGVQSYHDGFNNYCNKAPDNLHITFAGTNAKVIVEENVKINGEVEIEIYDDAEIVFQEKAFIEGHFWLAKKSKVMIGKRCGGRLQAIKVGENSSVVIGDDTTFTSRGIIIVANGSVEIGEDCMIAANNVFWCGDGHAIYDVNSGERTNKLSTKNRILIKDHVWVGTESIILSESKINSGCIVGAGSVVKGKFPNNCVIAGNPGKRKKNDVFWCRDVNGEIKESEKRYFNKTILVEGNFE